jgi:hypothetical protein
MTTAYSQMKRYGTLRSPTIPSRPTRPRDGSGRQISQPTTKGAARNVKETR